MALKGKFVIQEFSQFTEKIKEIYEECIGITDGKVCTLFPVICLNVSVMFLLFQNASYIPELASVDPSLWGVSLCTVSGQRWV